MTNPLGIKNLSLYHYQSCPFCGATREVIDQLGLNIELRNIHLQAEHLAELVREGGKPQVPCLRFEQENGRIHWLYESRYIIQALREYAGLLQNAA
ncbi:MAG: glutathione S-transferase N-terminal domain-containing protein [Proteobacteria bacterium]|nr:glutathione S-transferase N-terminal domain-containing protein [Pseudomonadota bacterium]